MKKSLSTLLMSIFSSTNLSLNVKFDAECQKQKSVFPFSRKIFSIQDNIIRNCVVDKNETVYVASRHEIYKFEIINNFKAIKIWTNKDEVILSIAVGLNGYIYVASGNSNDAAKNLYVSRNYGASFEKITKTKAWLWINAFAFKDDHMYVVTGNGLYISSDSGKNFRKIFKGYLKNITIAPNGNIYFFYSKNFFVSKDNGETFAQIKHNIFNSTRINTIVIDNCGIMYVSTEKSLYRCKIEDIKEQVKFTKLDITKIGLKIKKDLSNCKIIILAFAKNDFYKSVYLTFEDPHTITWPEFKWTYSIYQLSFDLLNFIDNLIKFEKPNFFNNNSKTFIYQKKQVVTIKADYLESVTLDGKNQIILDKIEFEEGSHKLILKVNDEYKPCIAIFGENQNTGQITYDFCIKSKINESDVTYFVNQDDTELWIDLTSNQGNTINQKIIQTACKELNNIYPAILNVKITDSLIDFDQSYCVEGTITANNDFKEIAIKEKISPEFQIIKNGIYKLFLIDKVGNKYTRYLEIGKSNWKLKSVISV